MFKKSPAEPFHKRIFICPVVFILKCLLAMQATSGLCLKKKKKGGVKIFKIKQIYLCISSCHLGSEPFSQRFGDLKAALHSITKKLKSVKMNKGSPFRT